MFVVKSSFIMSPERYRTSPSPGPVTRRCTTGRLKDLLGGAAGVLQGCAQKADTHVLDPGISQAALHLFQHIEDLKQPTRLGEVLDIFCEKYGEIYIYIILQVNKKRNSSRTFWHVFFSMFIFRKINGGVKMDEIHC